MNDNICNKTYKLHKNVIKNLNKRGKEIIVERNYLLTTTLLKLDNGI